MIYQIICVFRCRDSRKRLYNKKLILSTNISLQNDNIFAWTVFGFKLNEVFL